MRTGVFEKSLPVPGAGDGGKKPSELRFQTQLLGTAVVVGAALQLTGPWWIRAIFEQIKIDSFAGVSALLLAAAASMLVHELGHLVAALCLNYEIVGCGLGPWQYERQHGKGSVLYDRKNWFRCSVSAVARDFGPTWRKQMIVLVAAGPSATLLLLLIAARAAFYSHDWLNEVWSCGAEVNFFLFFLGLIPNGRLAAVRNDARLLVELCGNSADAGDMFMCQQAIQLAWRGIRPEDYPPALMLELAGFHGRPYTNLMVARRMVEWATDSGDMAAAASWQQHAVSASKQCSLRERNRTLAEAGSLEVLRGDLAAARVRFGEVEFDRLSPPALAERARAARLLACGLPQRAPAHILRAQYQLPLGIPYYNYERMLLEKLHDLALAHSAGT